MKSKIFILVCVLAGGAWGYCFVPEIQAMIDSAHNATLLESAEYTAMDVMHLTFLMLVVGLGSGTIFGICLRNVADDMYGIFPFLYAIIIIPMIILALSVLVVASVIFAYTGFVVIGIGVVVLFLVIKLIFGSVIIF